MPSKFLRLLNLSLTADIHCGHWFYYLRGFWLQFIEKSSDRWSVIQFLLKSGIQRKINAQRVPLQQKDRCSAFPSTVSQHMYAQRSFSSFVKTHFYYFESLMSIFGVYIWNDKVSSDFYELYKVIKYICNIWSIR